MQAARGLPEREAGRTITGPARDRAVRRGAPRRTVPSAWSCLTSRHASPPGAATALLRILLKAHDQIHASDDSPGSDAE
jgi:hypothetical protein